MRRSNQAQRETHGKSFKTQR